MAGKPEKISRYEWSINYKRYLKMITKRRRRRLEKVLLDKAPIKNEADNGHKNLRGTIAMARTSDIHSATSQFFINVVDNQGLDHGVQGFGYAVFGKVIKGIEVVDAIKQVETRAVGPMQNVPVEPVIMKSVKVKQKEETKDK